MKRTFTTLAGLCCLTLALSMAASAQAKLTADSDPVKQVNKAATVLNEIMATPDKAIPGSVFGKAVCVGVFPDVIKAGFVVGARGGRGVATCKTAKGWSGPAYFNMKGGSFGLQIGAQSTDFVLLFMNDNGMKSLLSSKFEMGGDASVAAGPVGRQAGASTDLKLDAQILSYSRSKGLFAGLELKGTVISVDGDDMKDTYGAGVEAKDVLQGTKPAPAQVRIFQTTVAKYAKALKAPVKRKGK